MSGGRPIRLRQLAPFPPASLLLHSLHLSYPLRHILVLVLLVFTCAPVAFARQLLADGSDTGMWVASTVSGNSPVDAQTIVLGRKTGSSQWDGIYQIASYASSLTHQRSQPVLLTENGQWMFLFRGGRLLIAEQAG